MSNSGLFETVGFLKMADSKVGCSPKVICAPKKKKKTNY
jgi:hypothetical protein